MNGGAAARIGKWAGGIATVLAIMSAVVGVWLYLERDRLLNESWLQQDELWNTETLSRLEALEIEMAAQTQTLSELRADLITREANANANAEELEEEHENIREAIYEVKADVAHAIGLHEGAHHR